MPVELKEAIYTLIGALIALLLTSIMKWHTEKKERRRIKTAEYFSALSKYVDYIITITFYPKSHVEKNREQVLLQLEALKGKFIESQCLLVAFNFDEYLKTKAIVSDAISIDGEFTKTIFDQNFTTSQLRALNGKALKIIKSIQTSIEISAAN